MLWQVYTVVIPIRASRKDRSHALVFQRKLAKRYVNPRLFATRPLQVDRHLPTMTVQETFQFAFDHMMGGTHGINLSGASVDLTDDQKDLIEWMNEKRMKVFTHGHMYYQCCDNAAPIEPTLIYFKELCFIYLQQLFNIRCCQFNVDRKNSNSVWVD